MGAFSGKKKTYVSSVVYNLAGPEKDRANYLKTLVISNKVSSHNTSITDTITQGYLTGPGIKLRNFTRWAKSSGYSDLLGIREGELTGQSNIRANDVSPHIPHDSDEDVVVESAEIGSAELSSWVARYILETAPNRINEEYVADFNESSDVVTIVFPDNNVMTFTPTGFDPNGRYLYVSYKAVKENQVEPIVVGIPEVLSPSTPFPERDDEWELLSEDSQEINTSLTTSTEVTVSYSDGRPDEETTNEENEEATYQEYNAAWEKIEKRGRVDDVNKLSEEIFTEYHVQTVNIVEEVTVDTVTETIEDDVVKTTETTVTKEVIKYTRTVQQDTQILHIKVWSNLRIFIYQQGGSNSGLNALFNSESSLGDFFPFIPMREYNEFLSSTKYPEIYDRSKYALKKAVDGSYDSVVEDVADNESIGDIDFAYVVFGVSLNVQENSCKKYVYNFFTAIREQAETTNSITHYEAWRDDWIAVNNLRIQYGIWFRAQRQPSNPLFGSNAPPSPAYPQPPSGQIALIADGPINFNFNIKWNYIYEMTGVGKLREDKNRGDLWFDIGNSDLYDEEFTDADRGLQRSYNIDKITLYWQDTAQTWRAIVIGGLRHVNHVYKGNSVDTSGVAALNDEEESGFIIPLHDGIYRAMSLKDATQMSTACTFLVFNCYQVVKQKWYQTGIFKVFIIIVAIVISVYFPPGGGILGSATQVGTALGFTGTAAVIAGTVANAVAAIVITQIIQKGATALFGDKVGSIVGAIASVVAITVGSAYLDGSSISAGFTSLTRADNLLKLTNAVGEGYAGYMQGAIAETNAMTQEVLNEYAATSEQINAQYEKLFGDSGGIVNPSVFTNAIQSDYHYESSTAFLDRTLMLGSDIAELSIRLLDNFVEITTSTKLD